MLLRPMANAQREVSSGLGQHPSGNRSRPQHFSPMRENHLSRSRAPIAKKRPKHAWAATLLTLSLSAITLVIITGATGLVGTREHRVQVTVAGPNAFVYYRRWASD